MSTGWNMLSWGTLSIASMLQVWPDLFSTGPETFQFMNAGGPAALTNDNILAMTEMSPVEPFSMLGELGGLAPALGIGAAAFAGAALAGGGGGGGGAVDSVLGPVQVQPVPEPSSVALFGFGMLAAGIVGWRRRTRI